MSKSQDDGEVMAPRIDEVDRNLVYRKEFDRTTRIYLKRVIDTDLIEEHRRNPIGPHSEPLGRLLAYFRRLVLSDQYALYQDADGRYRLFSLAERHAVLVKNEISSFDTLAEAYHAVFLKKLEDLMEQDDG